MEEIHHIACKSSRNIWVSDLDNQLIHINYEGEIFHNLRRNSTFTTGIAIHKEENVLFTDVEEKWIFEVMENFRIAKFLKTEDWVPRSIHSSCLTGDIFLGLTKEKDNEAEAKISRYDQTGKKILQEIQLYDEKPLYRFPHFMAENDKGNIYVSDYHLRALVAVNKFGKHLFDFKTDDFWPHGVTVDNVGNVLVCNASYKTSGVFILDQEGNVRSRILTREQKIRNVRNICVDEDDNLYALQKNVPTIMVFKYLERV
ncbi:tripartite motif-containing protein 2-like [Saccostrea echinata]|uniref:tripartite motif-containing protein 2-like n=1 Tax=Saccostrea echinata TaxID=191078 RepID=UPI002A8068FE|nr:tripartite motif-containing protein 2-like [Saccostrea echinata]